MPKKWTASLSIGKRKGVIAMVRNRQKKLQDAFTRINSAGAELTVEIRAQEQARAAQEQVRAAQEQAVQDAAEQKELAEIHKMNMEALAIVEKHAAEVQAQIAPMQTALQGAHRAVNEAFADQPIKAPRP